MRSALAFDCLGRRIVRHPQFHRMFQLVLQRAQSIAIRMLIVTIGTIPLGGNRFATYQILFLTGGKTDRRSQTRSTINRKFQTGCKAGNEPVFYKIKIFPFIFSIERGFQYLTLNLVRSILIQFFILIHLIVVDSNFRCFCDAHG